MILRLKEYTRFIFDRYYNCLKSTKQESLKTVNDKLIISSFSTTGQTVLFFNQSDIDQSFLDWSISNPECYQLKINHCLSMLVDSCFWALLSFNLELEDFPEKSRLYLDLSNYRIEEEVNNRDGITKQYFSTCDLLHRICPSNTRLKESLNRLIWSYLSAKELTHEARDIKSLDRISYLRKLTTY